MLENIKKYPKSLQLSIIEGMVASLMFGGGTIFITAFAVFLGATSFELGLLFALPALLGAWLQLGSLKLLKVYKKRRNAIAQMVFLQALSWLLIALIPFIFPTNQVVWLIIITTLGTLAGSIAGPLWQSWMRSLTPEEILGEYFGVRNAITGAVVLFTMLGGGLLLNVVEPSMQLYAFFAICFISFLGRLASSITFTKIDDPDFVIDTTEKVKIFTFIKQLRKDNFGYFVLFGTLMTFSISMVGPFFSLYLLQTLNLQTNYLLYTLIICASAASSLISMPYWGKIVDNYGTIKVLKATGFLACIYPIFLIFVRDPIALIGTEILAGVIFSGFNLCLANFIYESFKAEKIIKYASYQGTLFGTATFFGILLSGYLLTFNISIGLLSTMFYLICLISLILRLFFFGTLINKIKEVRETKPITDRKLILSVLTFGPLREPLIDGFIPIIYFTENTIKKATTRTINTVGLISKKGEEEIVQTVRKVGFVTKNEFEKAKTLIKRKNKGFF
ncbi:MAG: MFS transporter [archaeon]|jgi:MFS family permease